jgi:molecular chaperone DnaK (HSP70)
MPVDGSCIIAIDFGTSRSAFAYGFVGKTDDIRVAVPNNSVANAAIQMKAETSLVLNSALKAIAFGSLGRQRAYVEAPEQDNYLFQWFKMHLKDIKSDNDMSTMAKDNTGRPVPLITVITQALEYVSRSAVSEVNALGHMVTMHDIYWIITVPAIWSPAASGFMRRAAFNAGIIASQLSQRLTLVREPEGACLDLLNSVDNKSANVSMPVGSEIVVLDCGGGTNDMTFVRIESANPIRCNELKDASGGSFGASNIDKKLTGLLEELVGASKYAKIKTMVNAIEMLDMWEQFKIGFDGEGTYRLNSLSFIADFNAEYRYEAITDEMLKQAVERYNQARPPQLHIQKANSTLLLRPALLRTWFDEVIDGITSDLKKDMIDPRCTNVKFVYLVGGFCANHYVHRRIVDFVTAEFGHRQVRAFRANFPDIAVVKGAVLSRLRRGNQALIKDHIAKYSYGFAAANKFNEKIHDKSKSFLAGDGVTRVREFVVYVKKGDSIPLNFETPTQKFQPVREEQMLLNMVMYVIDDVVAPDVTVYIDDPRIVKFASLEIHMCPGIPYSNRVVDVSVKFGMETIIVAKDREGKPIAATCEYFAMLK